MQSVHQIEQRIEKIQRKIDELMDGHVDNVINWLPEDERRSAVIRGLEDQRIRLLSDLTIAQVAELGAAIDDIREEVGDRYIICDHPEIIDALSRDDLGSLTIDSGDGWTIW